MKFHIVCEGETLERIAFLYSLSEEELQKENKHIRVWNRLIPGTKLKIPIISEVIDQDVSSMEPFVEDYYPKLKLDNYGEPININQYQEIKVEKEANNKQENIIVEPDKESSTIQSTSQPEIKTFDGSKSANEVIQPTPSMQPPQPTITPQATQPVITPQPMFQKPIMQPQMVQQPMIQPQMIQQPTMQPQMYQQPMMQPQMYQQLIMQPQMVQQPVQPYLAYYSYPRYAYPNYPQPQYPQPQYVYPIYVYPKVN
jgi:hypothetical protein